MVQLDDYHLPINRYPNNYFYNHNQQQQQQQQQHTSYMDHQHNHNNQQQQHHLLLQGSGVDHNNPFLQHLLCNTTTTTIFTGNEHEWVIKYPNASKLILIVLCVSALLGIAWNLAVAFMIFSRRQFQTPSNFYVLNRAIADVLIQCSIPLVVVSWTYDSLRVGGVVCLFFSSAVQVGYVAGAVFLILLSYDCCLSRRSGTTVRWKVLLVATLGTWLGAGLLTAPVYWLEKAYWRATGECRVGPLFHMVVAPLSLPILILFVVLPILLSWTFLALGLRSRKVTLKKGQSADGVEKGLVKLEKVKKLEEVKKGHDYAKRGNVKSSDARRLKDVHHKKGAAKRTGDIKGMKKVEKGVDRRSIEVRESSSRVVEKRSAGAVRGSIEVKEPTHGMERRAPKGTIELMEWEEDDVGTGTRSTQVNESQEVTRESGEVKEMEKRAERRLAEVKDFRQFEKEPYRRSTEAKERLSEVNESKPEDKEATKMSNEVLKEPKSTNQQQGTTTTQLKKSTEPKDPKKAKPGTPDTTSPAGSFEVTRSFVAALILTFTMCQAPHWTYRYFYSEHDQGYNFYINTFFLLLLQFNQVINPFLWLGHSRRAPYND